MEKQNFEFGRIISKYGIVKNTFPYFGDLGHCNSIVDITPMARGSYNALSIRDL
jgi:hypothetical protein